MRTAVLALLVAAACGDPEDPAPRFDGRTATEWAADLADDEARPVAKMKLQSGGARAVPVLAAILDADGDAKARGVAIELVLRLGPAAAPAAPALVKSLKDKNPAVRGFAALALGRIGPGAKRALIPLERTLADPYERVRVAAALAVWGIAGDGDTAMLVLLRGLVSENPAVRAMAAEGLSELGARAVRALLATCMDEDPRVRAAAAKGLGLVGPPAAAMAKPRLEALAKDDEDADVRREAKIALTRLQE